MKKNILIIVCIAIFNFACASDKSGNTSNTGNANGKPSINTTTGPAATLSKFYDVLAAADYTASSEDDPELSAVITTNSFNYQRAILREAKMNTNAVRVAARLWAQSAGLGTPQEKSEVLNEKIEGNKATLEVKDARASQTHQICFLNEDGSWKLDMVETDKQRRKNN